MNKLKATRPRQLVFGLFHSGCNPLCAEDIFARLKLKSDIGLASIYRTLASFEKAGILKRVNLHKESVYYELADNHHHHAVCKTCGLIESLGECGLTRLSKEALRKSSKFKSITEHSLEFFGVCKKCSVIN